MDYSRIMKFKGTWRNYQARVLQNAEKYIADGKIHIVAAPGSGKTTLGIELIGRMAQPALVLTPSITIREQWVERIKDGFLNEDLNYLDYISQDLKNPRVITVVTYQALHSAMIRYQGALRDADDAADDVAFAEEVVDYSDFDIVQTLKECQIGTLCLDECHHLRAEWWKSLEAFQGEMGNVQLIALTATPPYDSTPAFWRRYMDMCGEIDEEIAIPELVKEGSLCPHQDYVYFNYPTEEERTEVEKFKEKSQAVYERLLQDTRLQTAVESHGCLHGDDEAWDALLENREYMTAFFVYLQTKKIAVPESVRLMAGECCQSMSPAWMERLLQGFLYEDNGYSAEAFREELEEALKAQGLIEKRRVAFTMNDSLEKLLMTSKGKCSSIHDIVQHEFGSLGKELRLLVLTDYIRKEYERALGDLQSDVTALGVLPFFEQLRRSMPGQLRLGVLCGTIVIVPAEAKAALLAAVGDNQILFSAIGSLPESDYVKVTAVGDAHFLTGAVTDIFTQGYMQVLIGTKSLLGEGWDAPCINSLILASFVGSFMLSNQMRGRAIRVFRDKPDKTSNIWHLVCLPPDGDISKGDYALLLRRMEHFLGLHDTKERIESGIGRLSVISEPFEQSHVEQMNRQMLALSCERASLKERWMRALSAGNKQEIVDVAELETKRIPAMAYTRTVKKVAASLAATLGFGALGIAVAASPLGGVLGVLAGVSTVTALAHVPKLLAVQSPEKRLEAFAIGVHKACTQLGLYEDAAGRTVVEEEKEGRLLVYLEGGTNRDKQLFSKCMKEVFGAVDGQRYVLQNTDKKEPEYYGVPEVFGRRREDAALFYECVRPMIGAYHLVYTRNENGRKVLLDARMKTAANAAVVGGTRKCLKG